MKKYRLLGFASLLLLMSACLTYEKMSVRIVFNDTEKLSGEIFISMIGMASTEDSLHKQQKDFDEILEYLEGDEFLLDELETGIYVKSRQLTVENKKLVFKYSGIFNKLIPEDGFEIKNMNDELVIILKKDDMNDEKLAQTNGKIESDSLNTYIKWPRGTKEVYWETILKDDSQKYSLIPFYEKWTDKK